MEHRLTQQPSSPVRINILLLETLSESVKLMAIGLDMHLVWVSVNDCVHKRYKKGYILLVIVQICTPENFTNVYALMHKISQFEAKYSIFAKLRTEISISFIKGRWMSIVSCIETLQ